MKKFKNCSESSKGLGNSSSSPSLWFCFTKFNYSFDDIELFQCSGPLALYIFQEEICPDTGREHLQGVVRFKKKTRLKTINKLFPNTHWETCKNRKKSIEYCSKENSRKPGSVVFTNMEIPEQLITLTTLHPWQKDILKITQSKRDDRTVNWFWDHKGNIGKTSFSRWLVIKHKAFYICGNAVDMKFGLADIMEKTKIFPKIVILDIPRDSLGCSYKGIEQIKNGIFYSTKYKSGMVVFNPPHMIVFANNPPDEDRMSNDRWMIIELSPNGSDSEAEAQVQQVGPDTDSD